MSRRILAGWFATALLAGAWAGWVAHPDAVRPPAVVGPAVVIERGAEGCEVVSGA